MGQCSVLAGPQAHTGEGEARRGEKTRAHRSWGSPRGGEGGENRALAARVRGGVRGGRARRVALSRVMGGGERVQEGFWILECLL